MVNAVIGTLQAMIVKPGIGSAITKIGTMQIGSVTVMIVFMSISNLVMDTVVFIIVSVKITYFVDYLKLTNKVLFEKVYFSHCCEDFLGSSLPSENNMHYLGKIDIIV